MSFLGGGESLNLSLSRVEEGWGNPIWGLEINLHGRKASILPIRLKGGGGNINLIYPGLGSIQSGVKKPISRGGKPQSCLTDVWGGGEGREISISSNLGWGV